MRYRPTLTALTLALTAAGCGGKPKPEEPAPMPPRPTPVVPTETARPAVDPSGGGQAASRWREQVGERIHFGYDRADLTPLAQQTLAAKADLLRQRPGVSIRIEGHADERGSDEYNLALGNRRALAAKRYLVQQGVGASRIETASLGEEQPADPGHDESAWAANRRAEFRITAGISSR